MLIITAGCDLIPYYWEYRGAIWCDFFITIDSTLNSQMGKRKDIHAHVKAFSSQQMDVIPVCPKSANAPK